MEIEEIEHKIACNEINAAQVFTQMKQHIALVREHVHNDVLKTFDAKVKDSWSPRYGDSSDRCLIEYSVTGLRKAIAMPPTTEKE